MFGLMTVKKHKAAIAMMAKANVDLEQMVEGQTNACRSLAKRLTVALLQRDEAREEAAANVADAQKYRRSRANLKQFKAREKQTGEVVNG